MRVIPPTKITSSISAAFNPDNRVLYVCEFALELDGMLVIHAWRVNHVTTSVNMLKQNPEVFWLYQNYPNPCNPATTIRFNIPHHTQVKLTVYNFRGQQVVQLLDKNVQAGSYTVIFDTKELASGIYLYRIIADGFTQIKKLVVVK